MGAVVGRVLEREAVEAVAVTAEVTSKSTSCRCATAPALARIGPSIAGSLLHVTVRSSHAQLMMRNRLRAIYVLHHTQLGQLAHSSVPARENPRPAVRDRDFPLRRKGSPPRPRDAAVDGDETAGYRRSPAWLIRRGTEGRVSWGRSSVGRALHSHCRGRGFDSPRLHLCDRGFRQCTAPVRERAVASTPVHPARGRVASNRSVRSFASFSSAFSAPAQSREIIRLVPRRTYQ